MKAEDFIRKQIRKILTEGEEKTQTSAPKEQAPQGSDKSDTKKGDKKSQKPKRKRKIKGGGRGRVKASISQAGARAQEEPAELLKDLGVKAPDGDSDAEKITNLMRSAIYGNAIMGAAYAGAVTDQDQRLSLIHI